MQRYDTRMIQSLKRTIDKYQKEIKNYTTNDWQYEYFKKRIEESELEIRERSGVEFLAK